MSLSHLKYYENGHLAATSDDWEWDITAKENRNRFGNYGFNGWTLNIIASKYGEYDIRHDGESYHPWFPWKKIPGIDYVVQILVSMNICDYALLELNTERTGSRKGLKILRNHPWEVEAIYRHSDLEKILYKRSRTQEETSINLRTDNYNRLRFPLLLEYLDKDFDGYSIGGMCEMKYFALKNCFSYPSEDWVKNIPLMLIGLEDNPINWPRYQNYTLIKYLEVCRLVQGHKYSGVAIEFAKDYASHMGKRGLILQCKTPGLEKLYKSYGFSKVVSQQDSNLMILEL